MLRQLRIGCFPGCSEEACVIFTCPCEVFTPHSTALPTNYICMSTVSIAQRYNLRSAKYRLNRDFLKNTRLPKEHPAPSTELTAKSFSLEGLHNKQINHAPTKQGSAIKTGITEWFALLASFHISYSCHRWRQCQSRVMTHKFGRACTSLSISAY